MNKHNAGWEAVNPVALVCHVSAGLFLPQVASALAARHIGGAVNYVGVAETLSIGASAQAAGLAADSLICAFYFAGIFKLASRIGPDPAPTQTAAAGEAAGEATSEAASEGQAKQSPGGIQVRATLESNHMLCTMSSCSAF